MRTPRHPPEALYSRIRACIEAMPAAGTRRPARTIGAVAVVIVATAMTVLIASEMVYGRQAAGLQLGLQATSTLVWVSCMLLVLTFAATAIALWRGGSGLGARVLLLAFSGALVAPIYAFITVPSSIHSRDFTVASVAVSPWGLRCFAIAAIVGVVVLASLGTALHRAVPVAHRLRGTALGAAAGAWAGLAVFSFCPSGDPQHLLFGHVLPIAALTVLGGYALSRILRP